MSSQNDSAPKKLTTREVTDSRLLMIMIAHSRDEKSQTAARVVQTVEAELRSGTADMPVYDVCVSINGIPLDFREFAAEVQRQLDGMVMRAASELLKQTVDDSLDDLLANTRESLQRLNEGLEKKAAELLARDP